MAPARGTPPPRQRLTAPGGILGGSPPVAPGDHAAQARQALANVLAVLHRHGAGPADLVRTTIYVVGEQPQLVLAWDAIAAGLAPHRPPSTLLGVSCLGWPGQLVEIDGIAALHVG